MAKNSPETTFIKKLFKNKEPKELTKADDIEQVVLQQHKSAKQIKKLTDDIQHNQHKAAVGTSDLISQLKHLENIEKKRQKLTQQYIKQQREDPTLSPLKIVQVITKDQDTLPPYSEPAELPTAPSPPDLAQIQTILSLPTQPFAASHLQDTLRQLNIPDFDLQETLTRNDISLQNEIEQLNQQLEQQKQHNSPHPQPIDEILQKIQLLRQLKDLLPNIYKNDTSLQSPYRRDLLSGLSSQSHSHHSSPTRSPSLKQSEEYTESRNKNPDQATPYSGFYDTPLQNILTQLDQLNVDTKQGHEHWEFQLNRLQNKLVHEYTEVQTNKEEENKKTMQQFTYLDKLLHKIQILFGEISLSQILAYKRIPQEVWQPAHLFGIKHTDTKENNISAIEKYHAFITQICHCLDKPHDAPFRTHYRTQFDYLTQLKKCINTVEHEDSAGFSIHSRTDTISPQKDPARLKLSFTPQTPLSTHPPRPRPTFYTEVNHSRYLPKDLLSGLEPGQEIQWARITQATLDEFPNIEAKLKLKSLMHQLTRHLAAKQAASAQLLQTIQDPEHNPLKAFFHWIEQSFGLTPQEQNTQLRIAIEKQKFDWTSNPAIDLQNAISQVHMSLPEINNNEIFRETVKDALKYKLQPYYHLVADTPITALPERLRFIWKNIAIPKPQEHSTNESNQPIILHTLSKTDTQHNPPDKHAKDKQTQASPPKNGFARQIHDIQKQLGRIHQLQIRPVSFQMPPQRKS